jgi:ribosomal protein L36
MLKMTHDKFLEKLKASNLDAFNTITFLEKYKTSREKILAKTKYGLIKCSPDNLLYSKKASVSLAVNKTEYWINMAKEVHNTLYDYSKVEYIKSNKKVIIICKKHGKFLQTPESHLKGMGCPYCANNKNISPKIFLKRAKEIHNDNYLYPYINEECKNTKSKISIICKTHGVFKQKINNHLAGCRCPKCAILINANKRRYTKDVFIEKALKKHNNKYMYKHINFIDMETPIKILCKRHGYFYQKPSIHLQGRGCQKCREGYFSLKTAKKYKNKWINEDALLYLVKFFNKNEIFYKIGITTQTIKQRFCTRKDVPYNIKLINQFKINLYNAIILENKLHSYFKNYSYIPKIKFGGYTECFSKIDSKEVKNIVQTYINK